MEASSTKISAAEHERQLATLGAAGHPDMDASGAVEMLVDEAAQPGEQPPSFLPFVTDRPQRPDGALQSPEG